MHRSATVLQKEIGTDVEWIKLAHRHGEQTCNCTLNLVTSHPALDLGTQTEDPPRLTDITRQYSSKPPSTRAKLYGRTV
jgi:hypothetical protein